MSMFTIDFFELVFLAEACIPPRPIARAMFWSDLINKHYNLMTENERARMFEFINRHDAFKRALNDSNEDAILFYERFNPDNQYEILTKEGEKYRTFFHKGRYHIDDRTSVIEDYIESTTKLDLKNEKDY